VNAYHFAAHPTQYFFLSLGLHGAKKGNIQNFVNSFFRKPNVREFSNLFSRSLFIVFKSSLLGFLIKSPITEVKKYFSSSIEGVIWKKLGLNNLDLKPILSKSKIFEEKFEC